MAWRVHDLEDPAPQGDFVSLVHQPGGTCWCKRVVPGIESLEWDRIDQHLGKLGIAVLYLRSPGRREVSRKETGELALPGHGFLLTRMNKPFPEFVHASHVIAVSVSRDRDHPIGGGDEPIQPPGQRRKPLRAVRPHDRLPPTTGRRET